MRKESVEILNSLIQMDREDTLHGAFEDIPIEVYHHPQCPGFSSSQIKAIVSRSYAHFAAEKRQMKPCFDFGNAFHFYRSDRAQFLDKYSVGSFAEGKTFLKHDDFELIEIMSSKVDTHPIASNLVNGGKEEITFFSRDSQTGILKKCRPDVLKDQIISDYKSTKDASLKSFRQDCRKFGTRISAAYYLEIVSEVLGAIHRDFRLIACEKNAPYEIAVYRVDERSIAQGEEEVRLGLSRIAQKDQWAGYTLEVTDLII